VIRGECRNHPTTSAVLVCKVRPLQIHPQGRPPVSVGSGIRRASGAVSATMKTLLYPSSRLPATSDRRQASLGGLLVVRTVAAVLAGFSRQRFPDEEACLVGWLVAAWPCLFFVAWCGPSCWLLAHQEGPVTAASPRRPPAGAAGDRRRPGPSTRAGGAVGVRVRRGGAVLEGRGVSGG
jgi:hypothetical protein